MSSRRSLTQLEQEYLDTLDEKELIAYRIACSLGSLFSLNCSNGYLDWIKKRETLSFTNNPDKQ